MTRIDSRSPAARRSSTPVAELRTQPLTPGCRSHYSSGTSRITKERQMRIEQTPLPAGIVSPDARVEMATFVAFLEGPAADAEGHVYFSDIRADRIMRLSPDGTLDVFREN